MPDFILSPWPWYVVGPIITLVMISVLLLGNRFGVSSSYRTLCTMCGADKLADYFKIDWKKSIWQLVFLLGCIVGGFISSQYLMIDDSIVLAESLIQDLKTMGIESPGANYLPLEIFSLEGLLSLKGIIVIVLGGFLVGFGTRYASGCTSGHAISGLSNLQLPSLIAVIGFFIGGMLMSWFIIPHILAL